MEKTKHLKNLSRTDKLEFLEQCIMCEDFETCIEEDREIQIDDNGYCTSFAYHTTNH